MPLATAHWTLGWIRQSSTFSLVVALSTTCVAALPAVPAVAAKGAPDANFSDESLRLFIAQRMQATGSAAFPIQRVDIKLGTLDSRVQLAPCAQVEPYVPAGAKLWGRTVVGVRCVSGATWNMMMPITVSIWGMALVAKAPMAAGTQVSPGDFQMQDVEWSREASIPVFSEADLSGRTLSRALQAGQTVRADMLRATPVLTSGDAVTLRITGSGFAISAQGQALSSAADGQTVRVRTEQGRTLVGIARSGKMVEVAP